MTFEPNDDLARAKEALTILRLWEFAGLPAPEQGRDGKYKSPFRQERTASFNISEQGKVWCDFGGTPGPRGQAPKGGVWEFAERCWPNASAGEIAKKLIEASGIIPTPQRKQSTPATPGAAAETDPKVARAAAELERKRKLREAEDRVYEQRAKLLERPERKPALAWPANVEARWRDGVEFLKTHEKTIEKLAAARGWPVAWARQLVEMDLLSYPLERRCDIAGRYVSRQKAFRVDRPEYVGSHAVAKLEPIGYHQRFYIPARDNEPAQKKWMFVPSVPKYTPASAFERELVAYGAQHGSVPPSPSALTPPLPFVLGDLERTRLIVLLEGQWDAVSFFGACGWFYDDDQVEPVPEKGVAVFGIRGAQGIDPFLAHYWGFLQANKPRCWIIADNDAAGGAWRDAPEAGVGHIRPPSFAERLKYAGCRDVLVSWLGGGEWGKDFNDYYRAAAAAGRAPGPRAMANWFRRVGIMDENGRLAA